MDLSLERIKDICGLQYFTGAHSEIQKLFRSGQRPKEFGNKVWETSLRLIEFLDRNPDQWKGLRVLEIGCGWGLVGVYLAKVHSCRVTCCDLDPYVLPVVDIHSQFNGISVATKTARFSDWKSEDLKNFDLIIGAEVCYSEEVAIELSQMMERAFFAKVQQVMIADPGRPDFEEVLMQCRAFSKVELLELPGSRNGKTTQLLWAKNI